MPENNEIEKPADETAIEEIAAKEEAAFDKDLIEEKEVAQPEPEILSLYNRVQKMSVSEKIKLATLGNKQARDILMKDSNKLVTTAVIRNPRIGEDEVLKVVNSRSVSDDILRIISNNKEWMKNYHIKWGFVQNPKAPMGIVLRLLGHLTEKDLQKLAKSKNIPNVVATAAKKIVMQKARH